MDLKMNKYQTPLTDELIHQYPEEVIEQLYDFINNVEFIKWLISPDRPYAKDCPHDSQGRVIVDIAHPHIVEDMDYFRQPALHFMEHGCYTFLKPNSNPHSEYRKFWDEEIRRCREGYIRESDGEWVTGYCYYFLNYNPMMVNFYTENSKKAIRKESFPFFFEGIYWRFHYLWQARESGKHAIELAKRGAHPLTEKVFTPKGWKSWNDIKIGDKLYGSYGNETTVIDIPYEGISPCYKITLRDGRVVYASDDHTWNITERQKENKIYSTRALLDKYEMKHKMSDRCPSGIEHHCYIPNHLGIEMPFKETQVDPYTFGLMLGDGCFRHKSAYFTQLEEDFNEEKQYIPYKFTRWKTKNSYRIHIPNWISILKEYGLYWAKSEDKFIPDEYKYNSREVRLNILKGLCDTDATSCRHIVNFTTVSSKLRDDIMWVARSLGYNCNYTTRHGKYKDIHCLDYFVINIYAGPEIFNLKRKSDNIQYNNNSQKSRRDKTAIVNIEYIGEIPCKCVTVDSHDGMYLIGDFVQTHNCAKSYTLGSIMSHNLILGENSEVNRRVITVLTAYQKEYLSDSKDGTLSKFKPAINFIFSNTPFPRLMLKNSPNEMAWQMGYKDEFGIEKGSLNQVLAVSAKDDPEKLRGKRGWILFEEMGSFKGLLSLYDITRKSVEDGDYTFATMYLVGTAAEDESDFSSAKTLLYNPDGYNILSIKNVFDKPRQGKPTFGFFFPAYINRAGCYNKDGVSDVIKALLQILMARYKAKYSADPKSVLRVIAEDPITPAEAIIKVKAAYFPVTQLTERASQLDQDPQAYNDVYTGDLVFRNGIVQFVPTNGEPIRKWGVANNTQGALEIFEMPEKNRDGAIYNNRYVIGHDPVDNDQAESSSLSSTFVFDLFTDKIVAEYTGRYPFADDNFEMVRKLCIFYNARCLYESNKKGIYAYFGRMNCTHMLADTPEFLRDKQLIKYSSFGSNAKGVNASAAINDYANGLIRDWLLKPISVIIKEDGVEKQVEVPLLYTIRNRALLDELINFSPEINVDRIRALGMVMLAREEKLYQYQGNISAQRSEEAGKNYLGNDPFFARNYNKRKIKT